MHHYLIKTGNRDWDAPNFRVIYARDTLTASDPDALLHQRLGQVRGLLRKNQPYSSYGSGAPKRSAGGRRSEFEANQAALQRRFAQLSSQLSVLQRESQRDTQDRQHVIPLAQVVNVCYPNAMSAPQKVAHTLHQIWHFVSDSPADGESDSGTFLAIFGTVLMVLLMSVVGSVPFGVIAAIWLHEYASRAPV